ncbi:protein kinase [Histoplasma capsulatum var. duboisii H88]|uniref:Protein kinase n=1 Tax=Ajellomyces capsulatus (strain H88) TaxID=544711 RepID=A0A8A1LHD5_AJEC8|nr:protein kinase [Histoplasma capsulatum var. duboisii H88]
MYVRTYLKSDIVFSVADKYALDDFCRDEIRDPTPQKIIDKTRTVYTSRAPRDPADSNWGPWVLCGFGEARIGKLHKVANIGEAQPHICRAPEVSFMISCDSKVDIWNVPNLILDHLESDHLLNIVDRNGSCCRYTHMAKIVAFLGPPPPEFVVRSEFCQNGFDETGESLHEKDKIKKGP